MQYYQPRGYYRSNTNDERNLLLPLLLGAAVGFPIGYISSNKNNQYPYFPTYPPQYNNYIPQPYPIYPYPFIPY